MAYEIAVAIILIGIVSFLAYLSKSMDNEHFALKFGFFCLSFFMLLLGINYAKLLAVDNGASVNIQNMIDTAYIVFVWTSILVLAYMLVYYITKVIAFFKLRNEQKKEAPWSSG